jgi:hypothetical protein
MKDLLIKARNLIRAKSRWTQGALARDKNGKECGSSSPKAVCWCAEGALSHFNRGRLSVPALIALDGYVPSSVADFNDKSTHKDVIALFNKAINACN